jgi:triosephosphate isomerase (TIM)
MKRNKLLGGNWKLNCLLKDFAVGKEFERKSFDGCDAFIAVPHPYLGVAKEAFPSCIKVGAQDCSRFRSGAYTGETSAEMIREMGAEYVIIGHSERRRYFGEGADMLLEKITNALDAGLKVVLCVGEGAKEREGGRFLDVIKGQILALEPRLEGSENVDVAYEPVWAIGTGRVAATEEVSEVFRNLRTWLDGMDFSGRLVYGGSVSGNNCGEICGIPELDGFLVGNASLTADFNEIARGLRKM